MRSTCTVLIVYVLRELYVLHELHALQEKELEDTKYHRRRRRRCHHLFAVFQYWKSLRH